ncbi:MAG: DinB family protein [Bacteroidia bacterium]|nr:DinB family protein [Bacteroidia bacterium]
MLSIPTTSEYAPYYGSYIEYVGTEPVLDLLKMQLPETLGMFRALSKKEFKHRYHPSKWSVAEVLAHMIDTELVMASRAFRIARKEINPLPGFDQNAFIENGSIEEFDPECLIKGFEAVRHSTLSLAHLITPDQYLLVGTASGFKVSVRALYYIIAGHELHHTKILRDKYQIK